MFTSCYIIGSSHGLLCLCGRVSFGEPNMFVIWNVSVRKAVAVIMPELAARDFPTAPGFGVCRETGDPKIVNITRVRDVESVTLLVEVFSLSSGAWRSPHGNLPRNSIQFDYDGVVINGVLYWLARDRISEMSYNLIMSFDLTSEEFREVNLSDRLAKQRYGVEVSISKVREGGVVVERGLYSDYHGLWMMEDGVPKSFIKLVDFNYTLGAAVLGSRKSGELILEITKRDSNSLVVCDPCSKHFNNLGINGCPLLTSVYPYTETLLLLDHPDFIIYDKGERCISELRDEKREVLNPTSKGKVFGFWFKWLKYWMAIGLLIKLAAHLMGS